MPGDFSQEIQSIEQSLAPGGLEWAEALLSIDGLEAEHTGLVRLEVFYPDGHDGTSLTPKMRNALLKLLQLGEDQKKLVPEALFQRALVEFDVTDYGFEVADGEGNQQANMRGFKIYTKGDAFAAAKLEGIAIHGHDLEDTDHVYFSVKYDVSWGELVHVVFKDGKLITVYDDGVYFPKFDDPETIARLKKYSFFWD
jgi:hypothetical protein